MRQHVSITDPAFSPCQCESAPVGRELSLGVDDQLHPDRHHEVGVYDDITDSLADLASGIRGHAGDVMGAKYMDRLASCQDHVAAPASTRQPL
jgi:hypothetical protein